jgi:hypothetical protein
MTCKGICIRHKAQKPVGTGRYSTGQKRCQICELFLMLCCYHAVYPELYHIGFQLGSEKLL